MTLTPLSAPDRTRAGYLLQPALGPLAQEFETGAQRQQPKVGTTRAGQPHWQNRVREEHRGLPTDGRKMGGDTRENQKWESQEQLTTHSVPPGHTPSLIPLITLNFHFSESITFTKDSLSGFSFLATK